MSNLSVPRVSILLPCLNARRFLQARVESLLAQTIIDWEATILDSYSADGSWEYFEARAASDRRFHLHRIPREGLYAALNRGIQLARGEFLYIATCDDTMEPTFLAMMLALFAEVPAAGIAACDLRFIDADGQNINLDHRLGSECVRTATVGEELKQINYRPPPHDCLLHFAGDTVCWSLTQLLVRTALVRRAPLFELGMGTVADFGWLLGLTNLAGTIHLPLKLATWRFHGNQLSSHPDPALPARLAAMCRTGLGRLRQQHGALFSRNDLSALLLPSRILRAQASGHWLFLLACYLESGPRFLWMFAEHPVASWRALRRKMFRRRHLKQAWVGFILRRLGSPPRVIDVPLVTADFSP